MPQPPWERGDSGAASARAAQQRETQTQLPTCCSTCTAPASAQSSGGGGEHETPHWGVPAAGAGADVLNIFHINRKIYTFPFAVEALIFTKRENYLGFRLLLTSL